MTNIIKFPEIDDRSGYIISDKEKISGVYVDGLCADALGDSVFVGGKGSREITYPVTLSKSDMNEFCLMWLGMFNPEVLKED
jgi:hypothetical protein